jgi:hypothetical protein
MAPNRATRVRYAGSERRSAPRARSLLAGKIVVGDGSISFDCIIRDLSANGARVRLSRAIGLPRAVALLAIKDGLLFDAAVSWRIGDDVGLAFSGQSDLRRDRDPAHLGVRRLWTSLAPL